MTPVRPAADESTTSLDEGAKRTSVGTALRWVVLLGAGATGAMISLSAVSDDPRVRVGTNDVASNGVAAPVDSAPTARSAEDGGDEERWRWAVPSQSAAPKSWVSVGDPANAATLVVESAWASTGLAGAPQLGPTHESAGSSISDLATSDADERVILGLCCEPVSGRGSMLAVAEDADAQDLPLQGVRFDIADEVVVSVDQFGSVGAIDSTDPGSAAATGEVGGIDVAVTSDGSRVVVLTNPKQVEAQVGRLAETDGQELLLFERAEGGLVETGRAALDGRACAVTVFGGTTAVLMADTPSVADRCRGSTLLLGSVSANPTTVALAEAATDVDGDRSQSNLLVVGSSGGLLAMDLEGDFVEIAPAGFRRAAAW